MSNKDRACINLANAINALSRDDYNVSLIYLTDASKEIEKLWQEHEKERIGPINKLDYLSPDVPQGFDTVLGYLAKNKPHVLTMIDDKPEATARDGWWLKHQCNRRGRAIEKVTAPRFLQEWGIQEVNAYPVDLLDERLG